jgi:hypothetical protein|uniref:Uncharacterized protein n=1 Tax=Siphoviridae sp. ctM4P7 TaxID=2826256 RepID=A0A8S5MXS9_9CAUD|nr:MAG TPA: hypothetical protein [Siphoviridae sp. ctM4P7]
MTREEKIDQIVHKCRRTSDCIECKLYGYYAKCPVQLYLKNGTPMTDGSVYLAYKTLFENEETRKEFTKADLQDGMVVQLRNKLCFLVVKRNNQMRMVAEGGYYKGQDLTDNLKAALFSETTRQDLDVMKIFEAAPLEEVANISQLIKNKGKLLWERREEMTIEEVEKELGYKIKIVASPTEK